MKANAYADSNLLVLHQFVAQFCRVIFGMLVSLPLLVGLYIVLELIR